MKKDLDKKVGSEIVSDTENNDVEILDPLQKAFPFISFRYSCREISSSGGRTRVRSMEKSFENGKFKSEEFDGILPGDVYVSMVGEMQKLFFNQLTTFMKPFSIFLPSGSKDEKR